MPANPSSSAMSGAVPAGRSVTARPSASARAPRAPRPLKAEEVPAAAGPLSQARRVDLDLAQLNLAFLHVARELSRSAPHLAVTRLGLDADARAALARLSVTDLQALVHSQALIFGLRIDARDLPAQARLARVDPVASEARLVLAADDR